MDDGKRELKRCPICGSLPRYWQWNYGAIVECWCKDHRIQCEGKTLEEAIKAWERRADVEPVRRWIPVTERLPEKDNHCVLVTYKDGNDYFVKQMYYGKAYFERSSKICFYDSDSEYGDVEYRGVIAWMPLPTPYKGGEKE